MTTFTYPQRLVLQPGVKGVLASCDAIVPPDPMDLVQGVRGWVGGELLGSTHDVDVGGGHTEKLPMAMKIDRDGRIPPDVLRSMGEMGIFGAGIPEEFGGQGLDELGQSLVIEALNYGCRSVGVTASVQMSLVAKVLLAWCDHERKAEWLKRLAAGECIGCYMLSEAGSGSDAKAMLATCTKDGDAYILNGAKLWITSAVESIEGIGGDPDSRGVGIVFAFDPELRAQFPGDHEVHKAICAFVVDFRETEGVSVGKRQHKVGLRGSSTAEVLFANARVPASQMLGNPGKGFTVALHTLDGGRIGIAHQALGLQRRALDLAIAAVTAREQFGQRIADFQLVQSKLAEMAANYAAGRALAGQAAMLRNDGEMACGFSASAGKWNTAEHAMHAVRESLLLHGGMGFTTECEIETLYRDAPVVGIYEGTHNIQLEVMARQVLSGT